VKTHGACFDADGDGDQDLYVVSGVSRLNQAASCCKHRLYLNDRSENLQPPRRHVPIQRTSGSAVQQISTTIMIRSLYRRTRGFRGHHRGGLLRKRRWRKIDATERGSRAADSEKPDAARATVRHRRSTAGWILLLAMNGRLFVLRNAQGRLADYQRRR